MNEIRCREGVLNSANTYAPSCAVWYTRDMLVWQYSSELASVLTTYNVRVDSASERVEKLKRVVVTQNRCYRTLATHSCHAKVATRFATRCDAHCLLYPVYLMTLARQLGEAPGYTYTCMQLDDIS